MDLVITHRYIDIKLGFEYIDKYRGRLALSKSPEM